MIGATPHSFKGTWLLFSSNLERVTFAAILLASCSGGSAQEGADSTGATSINDTGVASPLQILETLAADDMAGRQTGTAGNLKARSFLREELEQRGLDVTEHSFGFENRDGESLTGVNLVAHVDGRQDDLGIVVTAHYDHVGTRDGEIFNGADDNASGVAGAFAVLDHFLSEPPEHDVMIVLLDGEEMGLQGARALLSDGIVAPGSMALNVNFDMLSKNDKNELYASGAYHNPALAPILEAVAKDAPVSLKLGHDRPEQGQDDWTLQSDHGAFHRAGIPFVYFGVEDHPDYHQPTDVFASVPQEFFAHSLETVVMATERMDAELDAITQAAE